MRKILSGILASVMLLSSFSSTLAVQAKETEPQEAPRTVAHRLYVAPDGSDQGDGSKEKPFKTVEAAKEAVKGLDKTGGDIVVEIADGFYSLDNTIVFDETDSGNENCTIYYEAAEGAKPVISGGKLLDGEWKVADDVDWLAEGVTAYKVPLDRDDKLRSIYVNGERASMTRKATTPLKAVGSYSVTKGQADWAWISKSNIKSGNVFAANFGLPADTRNPHNIELESGSTWVKAIVCADTLEKDADGNTQVNFQMPYAAIAQQPSWNCNYSPTKNNDVINVFEWLSKPGEFYFDQAGSMLYYIPKAGEDMSTAEVVIPELETLIDIKGSTPKQDYAQYLTFRGLTFAHSDWNLYEVEGSHGNATVQGCTIMEKFSDGNWHNDMYRSYDVAPAAIHATTAHDIAFLDGSIEMTGYLGLHVENDVYNIEITGNYIGHTGGGGVTVGHPQHVYENDGPEHQVGGTNSNNPGPDKEKFQDGTEAVPKNIYIRNNYFLENCYFFPGNSPIATYYTQNMWIEHNFIYKCSYSAMSIGWGWCNFDGESGSDCQLPGIPTTTSRNNHVNYNRIEEYASILQDCGGIYTLGQQGEGTPGGTDYSQYSEFNGNYINVYRETPDWVNQGRWINGFHPDEGSAYILFDSNVITNTLRNVYEMNNWRRKHDLVVTNGFSNSNRSETTAPNCTLDQYVNANCIWPKSGNNVVLNSGLEDEYVHLIDKYVMPDSYYELASNVRLSAGDALNRRGLLDAADEVWLAPAGTTAFEEGPTMTKAAGNEKTILAPEAQGEYKLYIKYANGDVSDASEFTVYVGEKKDLANVAEGEDYRVSQLNPLVLELDTDNYTFALNGTRIKNGHAVTTEGQWKLEATPIGESTVSKTVSFSTRVSDADKLLPRSLTVSPEGVVEFAESLNDAGKTIWLAPSGLSAFDENDPTQSKATGDSSSMKAPRVAGTYVLSVVDNETGVIISSADASVRVLNMVAPGNGIATYGTPTLGGDTSDPIWNSAPALVLEKHLTLKDGPASGVAKTMWDENNLYVRVEVQDPVLNSASSNAHEKDSIEIFVDEQNVKASSYQAGMGQYRISYENQQTFNGSGIQEGFESWAKIVDGGYVIEAKIPFKTVDPAANAKIGFDVQINDADATGTRQDIVMWYDESGNSWQSGAKWGEVTLEEKSAIPTNGLDMWFNADRGLTLGGDDGLSVLKWENQGSADVTLVPGKDSAPKLSTNENGVPALLFDGKTNALTFDGVNFNDKSELSLIVVTNYNGEKVANPNNDWTSGDRHSALFVTEAGGWGGMFVSPYQDWVSTRFGNGNQFCNIKYVRPQQINSSTVTISVKDGKTEKMFVDGENVLTKTDSAEKTKNIGSTMYIGKSISNSENLFFKGTISEILVYDRALSEAEVAQINSYLNEKHLTAQVTLESIAVTGPTKTEYETGEELDLTGLVVTAKYSDGSEQVVTDYEVSGYDASVEGEQTITVSYEGKEATFTVTVAAFDDGIDRSLLKDSIDLANLAKENYPANLIEAVKVKFEAALAHAIEVYGDRSGKYTQADVDMADDELVRMLQYLRFTADIDGLKAAIDHAKEVIASNQYENDAMMEAYKKALADAEALLAEGNITDTEIQPAVKALADAEANLNKAVNKLNLSRLQDEIGKSENTKLLLHLYFDGAEKDAFKAELAAAKEKLAAAIANPDQFTQDEIDKQTLALHGARAALLLIPNKDALKSLIDSANAIDQSLYTAESVKDLKAALAAANAVYADDKADETQIGNAEKTLQAAIDGLVLRVSDGGDSNKGDNANPGKDDNNGAQTGDTTNVLMLAVLLLTAAGAMLVLRRRKAN